MEQTALSLVPPILALAMVILTRRVLLSLGVGIVVGALMINNYAILASISQVAHIVLNIFYVDGALNDWELYIIFFLFLLGMIAALVSLSGGNKAFGEWAMARVKTRVGAQLTTVVLGIIIFIDDYFNSLAVGQVSRPLTDRHRVSRAKLAYLIDSTAAPVCILSPVSSWGAYIITIIGGILAAHSVVQYEALQAFLIMIPMNFYAIFAILLICAVALFSLDIGAMKQHEMRAIEKGELIDPSKGDVPGDQSDLPVSEKGRVRDLIWPIGALVGGTVFVMIYTGIRESEGPVSVLSIFENTDVALALLSGGLIGLIVALGLTVTKQMTLGLIGSGLWAGIKSMLPAVYILIFAWIMIEIIGELGTGTYLAGLVDAHLNISLLPALLFIIAGIMAFSTGTSWGTFGIMLPIAGEIAALTDVSMLLPSLAAVLAGSVFGDHCSPISDTTILSSTGAGCHHIDHFLTQLPYALMVAGITVVGYVVLGFTGSPLFGLLSALAAFGVALLILKQAARPVVRA
ncbi:Na+/H+ antiporter NhaC-like protein [Caldalkalibacillus thermarum TA2.A1]|uniref:Na+/H+ antiporter NhaC family protein n=1 Tax=Caldalkalibacillus thermarum (strain TA2.A1) TaxID=986075 RepID=F5L5M4_CALTT|nr:Na+/H+ antiporter NhaC family protein [Caldalkalibacillus thermarum]EGL83380.1 Na+/H+ antiporter NhaC-like protein [Caldalkalibacillus thermarum TA2.A1]QZT32862.1 Na+/H+ antiporter NhaC family protein [Caldalkalibacillus thermarum TA2.A1]